MCFQQHGLYYTEQIAGAENVKKKSLNYKLFLAWFQLQLLQLQLIIIVKNDFDAIYLI